MQKREGESNPQEPGIERTDDGRISATGWPHVPMSYWPVAASELQEAVQEQTAIERVIARQPINLLGQIRMFGRSVFNLGSTDLVEWIEPAIDAKLQNNDHVEICDVGGGNGQLLESAIRIWKNPYAKRYAERSRLETTMTTLVRFNDETLDGRLGIDHLLTDTAIELPPDHFYERFHIVIAQNSVLHWSPFPELTLLNLYKMTKSGGMILATVPHEGAQVDDDGTRFDTYAYLFACGLFGIEELKRKEKVACVQLTPMK